MNRDFNSIRPTIPLVSAAASARLAALALLLSQDYAFLPPLQNGTSSRGPASIVSPSNGGPTGRAKQGGIIHTHAAKNTNSCRQEHGASHMHPPKLEDLARALGARRRLRAPRRARRLSDATEDEFSPLSDLLAAG